MARGGDEFGSLFLSIVVLALVLAIAIVFSYVALIAIPAYVGYRLYTENPKRLERLARQETQTLYDHAVAGTVNLTPVEIDRGLSQHWPPDMPSSLRVQLLDVGRALFEQEGLSPDIPPLPALCNTVEGARYRDMLAKRGQARSDRVMVTTALDIISQAVAPIANAVPPIEGDVLVEVTQFTHPLGQAVENVVAPFFQDNDYMLFKGLRAKLDANLSATHRTNPIYPSEYKGDDVVDTYLRGTHLKTLFQLKSPFSIPDARGFEHMHIVAGPQTSATLSLTLHVPPRPHAGRSSAHVSRQAPPFVYRQPTRASSNKALGMVRYSPPTIQQAMSSNPSPPWHR